LKRISLNAAHAVSANALEKRSSAEIGRRHRAAIVSSARITIRFSSRSFGIAQFPPADVILFALMVAPEVIAAYRKSSQTPEFLPP